MANSSMPDETRRLRFGLFALDPRAGELYKRGKKVKVQLLPLQLLGALLEKPGEVISREELKSRLWPADTFVDFEHGLNTAVKKLRQALDDSPEEPRYVETLHKRGYRFLAPTDVEGAAPEPPPAPDLDREKATAVPRPRWRVHAIWLAALIGAAVLSLWLGPGDRVGIPPPNRQP